MSQDTSVSKNTSIWGNVKAAPGDPILSANIEYANDTCPQKVNRSIGEYKDENGNEYLLKCVKTTLQRYIKDEVNHEYFPMGAS